MKVYLLSRPLSITHSQLQQQLAMKSSSSHKRIRAVNKEPGTIKAFKRYEPIQLPAGSLHMDLSALTEAERALKMQYVVYSCLAVLGNKPSTCEELDGAFNKLYPGLKAVWRMYMTQGTTRCKRLGVPGVTHDASSKCWHARKNEYHRICKYRNGTRKPLYVVDPSVGVFPTIQEVATIPFIPPAARGAYKAAIKPVAPPTPPLDTPVSVSTIGTTATLPAVEDPADPVDTADPVEESPLAFNIPIYNGEPVDVADDPYASLEFGGAWSDKLLSTSYPSPPPFDQGSLALTEYPFEDPSVDELDAMLIEAGLPASGV
jgi:hypothetical protein